MSDQESNVIRDRDTFDHANPAPYMKTARKGLSRELVEQISADKNEPRWMRGHRLKCLDLFYEIPLPKFGPSLAGIDFDQITYYVRQGEVKESTRWEDVPEDIKRTFDRLGIPEAEKKVLAGTGAQYESEIVYHNLKEKWGKLGVVFENMDTALQTHEELVKQYFMKCVPPNLHKFAALHGAVWSGGTFLYIPKGVHVDMPLQAYFRMNARDMGQFEHTLIIVEDGGEGHYVEGCSAPKYEKSTSLHAGCVEVYVKKNAKFRYSSVENWSKNTYNLNTKRSLVDENARMDWINGNFGSCVTMLYPCSVLRGRGAASDHLGIAFANAGQFQDTGAKVIHAAPDTTSKIVAKSLSKGGGISSYRGLLQVAKGAKGSKSFVQCDALILDKDSRSDTVPDIKIAENDVSIGHEATAGKISDDQLFYLRARGLNEEAATAMIVNGFIDPIVRELPFEYAVEMNRLIELEMEAAGATG